MAHLDQISSYLKAWEAQVKAVESRQIATESRACGRQDVRGESRVSSKPEARVPSKTRTGYYGRVRNEASSWSPADISEGTWDGK